MSWPSGADGDVFRRLDAQGFDFAEPCAVDFSVDFESWPPPDAALHALRVNFSGVEVVEGDGEPGYVLFRVEDLLSYELVITVQREATQLVAPYGGTCESWGVLHS